MTICARQRCKSKFKPYNAKQIYCCKKCTNAAYRERTNPNKVSRITHKDAHIPDSMTADRNAYDWLAQ